jgi:hypothetical protein
MSVILTKIVANAGIVSACHRSPDGEWSFAEGTTSAAPASPQEAARIQAMFEQAAHLLKNANETEVKIVFGKRSLVIQTRNNHILGVVVQKGHAVVKSLQRMIRRSFNRIEKREKTRAAVFPAPAPAPEPQSTEPQSRPTVVDATIGRDPSSKDTNLLN